MKLKMTTTVTNGSADKAGLLNSSGAADEEPNLVGSSFSLVRYNNPILIDKHPETPSITPPSSGNSISVMEYKSNCFLMLLSGIIQARKRKMILKVEIQNPKLKGAKQKRFWTPFCRPENGRKMDNCGGKVYLRLQLPD